MKGTVLVVDDMPIIRDPIAATLGAAGYEALRAGNGAQALAALRSQPVDLILLDVNMPVMDGLSCLRSLRGNPSTAEIPVIMLSGAEDRQDVLQAAKLGIQGYILKSQFSLKDLLARVTKHFEGVTPAAVPIGSPKQANISSARLSASSPDELTVDLSPQTTKVATTPAEPGQSLQGTTPSTSQTSSQLNHKQCVERVKQAFHGHTLSGVIAEVISVAASPRSSASDLTTTISRDPLLSAQLLQVANSSANASMRKPVSTLPDAVRTIGHTAVRNIAATLGVFNAMPMSGSDGFNLLRCWQHAFAVATLCNHLASKEDSGLAYLIGLCHDLGEILFHSQFAEEYRQVNEIQRSTGKPRDEVEQKMLGMSQGELLQIIVQCLELRSAISSPILEYHSKGPASSGGSPLTRLLRVADLYANGMLLASSNESLIRPITCIDVTSATGQDDPSQIDRVAMRSEILRLTATLSRFPSEQQAELLAGPFKQQSVRIWLARDPALSSLDPIEAALESIADVTTHDALPRATEVSEHQALVIVSRSTSTSGFTSADIKQAAVGLNGKPLPVLWLVGRVDGEPSDIIPTPWMISVAKLDQFIACLKG